MTTPFQAKFSGAAEFEPVAEPLYGLRQFRVAPTRVGAVDQVRLLSPVIQGYVWRAGANVAVCPIAALQDLIGRFTGVETTSRHRPPVPTCHCGFWAYSPPAGEPVVLQSIPESGVRTVVGVVEAWGRMVVGTLGFRAEKARVVALAFPSPGATDPRVLFEPVAAITCSARRLLGRTPAAMPWERVTAAERDGLGGSYPAAAAFDSVEQMLAEFPLSDLSVFARSTS